DGIRDFHVTGVQTCALPIYRFSMANTYLIDDERLIVVDPGSKLNVRLTLKYLQDFLHRAPTDIDLVVLTHLHPDHTAGVNFLRQIGRASCRKECIFVLWTED